MIYPAIDVYKGSLVRLTQGDFSQSKIYDSDPLSVAEKYSAMGFPWIHLVDLSGSKVGKFQLDSLIKNIKKKTSLQIQTGGGIRSYNDALCAFDSGADRILLGSLLFHSKKVVEKIIQDFGPEKVSFCLDGKEENGQFRLYKNAWKTPACNLDDFLYSWKKTLPSLIFVTDINRDGTLKGPNDGLYERLLLKYPSISWAVSGGIEGQESIKRLKAKGIKDFIVGKAIYEKKIDLTELRKEVC